MAAACSNGNTAENPDSGAEAPPGERAQPTADWYRSSCRSSNRRAELIARGYFPGRSPDVTMTPIEPNLFGTRAGTTHSGPWSYLQKVPILWYGPGIVEGLGLVTAQREITVADIAPTLAQMLGMTFPEDRPGRPIVEVLPENIKKPKLVVVAVIDGGGWNVLNRWPKAWPYLKSLMERGTTIKNSVVGSSPSVTPAIHANIGTGAFPDQHGVVDIWLRRGDIAKDSYPDLNPRNLRMPTLAEMYDMSLENRPKVAMVAAEGWHLGMIGRGSQLEGGDKDIAVLEGENVEPTTNRDYYSLPSYMSSVPGLGEDVRAVDAGDGKVDDLWMGHNVLVNREDQTRSPVQALYQTRLLKRLIARENFGGDETTDLLFTNYKQVDIIGHSYNMVEPEMKSMLTWQDRTLKDLVRFLNEEVGRGEWVMAITADHGQGPDPSTNGGFLIDVLNLKSYIARQMGMRESTLFHRWRPTGYWLQSDLTRKERKAGLISDYVMGYSAADAAEIPDYYEGGPRDRIFESAFPMARADDVVECTSGN